MFLIIDVPESHEFLESIELTIKSAIMNTV
jgi:hypothetical protein